MVNYEIFLENLEDIKYVNSNIVAIGGVFVCFCRDRRELL